MTPKFLAELTAVAASALQHHPSSSKPRNAPVKKRHWLLGSCIILVCSWVTHTTTANIVDQHSEQAALSFAPMDFRASYDLDSNSTMLASTELSPSALSPTELLIKAAIAKPIAPTTAVAKPIEQLRSETHKIKRGEFLGSIFKRRGYSSSLPDKLSKHELAKQLVSLKVGNELEFKLNDNDELRELSYAVTNLSQLTVRFEDNEIIDAKIANLPYQTVEHVASAQISSSLYESALEARLSNNLIMEMVRIFGWDIDFVLDIRAGDTFHIVYTNHQMDGEVLEDGQILAAEFTSQGTRYRALRYEDEQGNISYYSPNGESMLGTFLRSPVEFSRISSRFGKRKHPILKTWRAHKGVDYAAGRGTPIRATADGKVTLAGKKGGYGRTIVIRHAGRFSTLYAHMNGFAKGIRAGSRVKQGQTIGYVGSTGLATGPHLHYEFRVDGVHRNPLSYKTPKASSIPDSQRAAFDLAANQWMAKLDQVDRQYQLALSESKTKPL